MDERRDRALGLFVKDSICPAPHSTVGPSAFQCCFRLHQPSLTNATLVNHVTCSLGFSLCLIVPFFQFLLYLLHHTPFVCFVSNISLYPNTQCLLCCDLYGYFTVMTLLLRWTLRKGIMYNTMIHIEKDRRLHFIVQQLLETKLMIVQTY